MEPGGSMPHSQGPSNTPYPEPNQPNYPHKIPISSRSFLILSSHIRLGLPKGLFLVCLPVTVLKALLPAYILPDLPISQSSRFNHPDYIWRTVQTMKFLLHSPFSSLMGPNICLRTLFSNTFSLHSHCKQRRF